MELPRSAAIATLVMRLTLGVFLLLWKTADHRKLRRNPSLSREFPVSKTARRATARIASISFREERMRIPAIALLASVALAAAPAFAKQTVSGSYQRTYGGGFRNAENPSLRWGKFSARNLSSSQIKRIQAGLDKAGFNAGAVNGKWGPQSRKAAMSFLKSKHKTSIRQLTNRDLADLGINRSMFMKGGRFYGKAKGPSYR